MGSTYHNVPSFCLVCASVLSTGKYMVASVIMIGQYQCQHRVPQSTVACVLHCAELGVTRSTLAVANQLFRFEIAPSMYKLLVLDLKQSGLVY